MGKLGCQILVQSKYFDTYRPVILVVGTYNIGMRFFSNYIMVELATLSQAFYIGCL